MTAVSRTAVSRTAPRALRRVRTWILGAGLAGLFGGMAVGWAVPRAIDLWLSGDPMGGNAETVKILAQKYGLTREQQRQIRMVLRARDRDMLEKYRTYAQKLPETLQSQIMSMRRHADERIYAALSEDQRERYLQDLIIEPPK